MLDLIEEQTKKIDQPINALLLVGGFGGAFPALDRLCACRASAQSCPVSRERVPVPQSGGACFYYDESGRVLDRVPCLLSVLHRSIVGSRRIEAVADRVFFFAIM